MEKPAKKIISMPVYSIQEGIHLGKVKSLVLDGENKAVIALQIEKRGLFQDLKIIPFTKVQHIGENVVTVDSNQSASRTTNIPQILQCMQHPIALLGATVLTETGNILGKVNEFWIFIRTGEISKIQIVNGPPGSLLKDEAILTKEYFLTMANGTIIVEQQAGEALITQENQLRQKIATAKDLAKDTWQTTLETGKKLTQTISQSLEQKCFPLPEERATQKQQNNKTNEEETDTAILSEEELRYMEQDTPHICLDSISNPSAVLTQTTPLEENNPTERHTTALISSNITSNSESL